MPLAFMMGVSWEDSFIVAELIGIKTFLNELLAYQKMSEIIKLRNAGGPEYVDNVKQYISVSLIMCNFGFFLFFFSQSGFFRTPPSPPPPVVARDFCFSNISPSQVHSEMIATYALCGFSNFANLGITFGSMCECRSAKGLTTADGVVFFKGICQGTRTAMIVVHLVLVPANFAPDRHADIAGCGLRALVAGSVSCFMTACIAGDGVWIVSN